MRNILIVDDHPIVLEIISTIGRAAFPGATVLCASDFAEAQEAAVRASSLDMTVLDLGLPGFFGIAALRRFRMLAPSVPVVVVSGTEDRSASRNWPTPRTARLRASTTIASTP